MVNRKNFAVMFVFVLMVGLLAGCAAAPVELPAEAPEVSMDNAMMAQQKAMEGMATGEVCWTGDEVSSLVTAVVQQYGGGAVPIDGVNAWVSDGQLAVQAGLTEGTVPGISSVELVGDVMVEDGKVKVALSQAGAGPISVQGPVLALVEGMINRALDDPSLGVAVSVDVADDQLCVSMGQ